MTNTDGRSALGGLWNSIQSWLFPMLEDEIGELDAKHRQFVAVCELCAPPNSCSDCSVSLLPSQKGSLKTSVTRSHGITLVV